ncbi:MAG: hypothetical protein IPL59_25005 [Candidatus Competibacteraceae bacterium]|nr:hypothetical protein [Candidatus Competibacteraceae bacterium]
MPKKPLVNQDRQQKPTVAEFSLADASKAALTPPEPQAAAKEVDAPKAATTQPVTTSQPQLARCGRWPADG